MQQTSVALLVCVQYRNIYAFVKWIKSVIKENMFVRSTHLVILYRAQEKLQPDCMVGKIMSTNLCWQDISHSRIFDALTICNWTPGCLNYHTVVWKKNDRYFWPIFGDELSHELNFYYLIFILSSGAGVRATHILQCMNRYYAHEVLILWDSNIRICK